MRGKWLLMSVLLLGLMLGAAVGLSLAQRAQPEVGAAPQALVGTGFTYQGRLTDGGSPANGSYDFRFILYDAEFGGSQVGSIVTVDDRTVTEGLFTALLDFGDGVFTDSGRWLEVAVRPGASAGDYSVLSPRQELTPAPYALALPGLRTEQNANSPNVIGGYRGNSVADGVVGATIGGGGHNGDPNQVLGEYGTVAGGANNRASGLDATVGGGRGNWASGNRPTVGGGQGNTAEGAHPTVSGGWDNQATGDWSAVGGGLNNHATGRIATIGGGGYNDASGAWAALGGGVANTANYTATTIGGGYLNIADAVTATISGGEHISVTGKAATVGGGSHITVRGDYDVVGGGLHNSTWGPYATIGGGEDNVAAWLSVVGGGQGNDASGLSVVGGGTGNHASGAMGTIGGGSDNVADYFYSTVPGGRQARASHYGEMAYAAGMFDTRGDAQTSVYVLRNTSTGSDWTELFLDGLGERLTIAPNRTLTFDIWVAGRSDGGESAGYHFWGVIENDGGTTAFVGGWWSATLGEDDGLWNAGVENDDANGALAIVVLGNNENIRWVAYVRTVEVQW